MLWLDKKLRGEDIILDTIVIGAGQAGLAIGYYLQKGNRDFVIVDEEKRIGDSWRNRYDSLRLFTPKSYSSLPGMRMEEDQETFPTKDEVADYLEVYASFFQLPVQLRTVVSKVQKVDGIFTVHTEKEVLSARNVIIATGAFQKPLIPTFSRRLLSSVFQLHSSQYKSPSQIPDGPVLVVGGGNSGAQIAVELAETRDVTMAVSHPLTFLPLRIMGKSMFYWLEKLGLLYAEKDTWRGALFQKKKDPIFGFECKEYIRDGKIIVKPKVMMAEENTVIFSDDSTCTVQNVIWSTGFTGNYKWIDIERALDARDLPIHKRGISPVQGLYYIGLPWQYQRGSALICGVGRDAQFLYSVMEKEYG